MRQYCDCNGELNVMWPIVIPERNIRVCKCAVCGREEPMKTITKIDDLIREGREAESVVNDNRAALGLLVDRLDTIKMAIIKEAWGAGIGTHVVYRDHEYIITQLQIQNRDVERLATDKPWAMGYRIKKDGKPSDQAFHIYDEWTLAEAKEE